MMNTAVDAAKTVSDDTKDISQASFIYLKKEESSIRFLFFSLLAEGVGFEPTVPCGITSFQD